ncbi:hypothetical protein JAAARDRAFT_132308, partial [Jaapia argillacea MUCL 33604]
GTTLAIVTHNSSSHCLRLFDIGRSDFRETMKTDLEPFHNEAHGEVPSVSFSPDGLYLAVGRNDEAIHVYDTRMTKRGPLYEFRHSDTWRSLTEEDAYGIVELQWYGGHSSSSLGLVSGGTDGCVRLWDVSRSSEDPSNGVPLVKPSNHNIGHFSLGKPFTHEKPLIV